MLTDEQVAQFQQDGFLLGPRVLADAELDALRGELMHLVELGPDGIPEGEPQPVLFRNMRRDGQGVVWQIVNIWEACPAFRRLAFHREIVQAIQQLTSAAELMVWHDQIQYKPAEIGGATNWHQDAPYWPIIKPMTMVTAWVALDDVDADNGCMSMVPGSHLWGDQIPYLHSISGFDAIGEGFTPPNGSAGPVKPRLCPVRAGEVHFHHSLTWHGSHENHSGRPRRAIAVHYMTGQTVYDASGNHPMKQFVSLDDGELMLRAGEAHFPIVCRDGAPVAA
jgi:ectoine hydroxylase-related dioxygenase (phytanoyl-CoA dioxygenase family)